MKRVFVSVPFNGRTKEDIEKELTEVAQEYKEFLDEFESDPNVKDKIIFVSNYNLTTMQRKIAESKKHPKIWYLGLALQTIADCDDVTFSKDWAKADGCKLEKWVYNHYMKES